MSRSTQLLLLTLFVSLPFLMFSQQKSWNLKSDKDNTKVYLRQNGALYEVKITTSIQAPLAGIVTLLHEVDQYYRWAYKVTSANMIKKISDQECYYRSKIDFPWPVDDRDIIMYSLTEQLENGTVIAKSSAVPDMAPTEPNYVRIRVSETKWTLVPSPTGWTYVEYYIYSNPGGSLPEWLVNMAIDVGPRETLKNMKTMLKQPKYRNAKLAYIKE
jgi:START domain